MSTQILFHLELQLTERTASTSQPRGLRFLEMPIDPKINGCAMAGQLGELFDRETSSPAIHLAFQPRGPFDVDLLAIT